MEKELLNFYALSAVSMKLSDARNAERLLQNIFALNVVLRDQIKFFETKI